MAERHLTTDLGAVVKHKDMPKLWPYEHQAKPIVRTKQDIREFQSKHSIGNLDNLATGNDAKKDQLRVRYFLRALSIRTVANFWRGAWL